MRETPVIPTVTEQEELLVKSMIEAVENKFAAGQVPDVFVFCNYPTRKVWHHFNPSSASYGAYLGAKARFADYCAARRIKVHYEDVDFDWPDDMQERVDKALLVYRARC